MAEPRSQAAPAVTPVPAAVPAYSILIVGYNSLRFLDGLFASLQATEFRDFEILFVDNGSPEPEAEWIEAHIREPRLRLFRSDRNLFFAGGVNLLAREAAGTRIVLLNPDTKMEPDWLSVIDRGMGSGGFDAVQADLRSFAAKEHRETRGYFLDPLGFIVHAKPREGSEPYPIFGGRGAGLVIRRDAFLEAGAMDADLEMYFEETDLCWRLNLLGYRIGYVPGSIIYHLVGGSSRPSFFRWSQFRFIRNRILCLIKNFETGTLARRLPPHLLLVCAEILKHLASLRPGLACSEAAALFATLRHLGPTLAKRRTVQAMRRVSDAELVERGLMLARSKYFPFGGSGRGREAHGQ